MGRQEISLFVFGPINGACMVFALWLTGSMKMESGVMPESGELLLSDRLDQRLQVGHCDYRAYRTCSLE